MEQTSFRKIIGLARINIWNLALTKCKQHAASEKSWNPRWKFLKRLGTPLVRNLGQKMKLRRFRCLTTANQPVVPAQVLEWYLAPLLTQVSPPRASHTWNYCMCSYISYSQSLGLGLLPFCKLTGKVHTPVILPIKIFQIIQKKWKDFYRGTFLNKNFEGRGPPISPIWT